MMGCLIAHFDRDSIQLAIYTMLEIPRASRVLISGLWIHRVQRAKGYVVDVVICTTSARECRKLFYRLILLYGTSV